MSLLDIYLESFPQHLSAYCSFICLHCFLPLQLQAFIMNHKRCSLHQFTPESHLKNQQTCYMLRGKIADSGNVRSVRNHKLLYCSSVRPLSTAYSGSGCCSYNYCTDIDIIVCDVVLEVFPIFCPLNLTPMKEDWNLSKMTWQLKYLHACLCQSQTTNVESINFDIF